MTALTRLGPALALAAALFGVTPGLAQAPPSLPRPPANERSVRNDTSRQPAPAPWLAAIGQDWMARLPDSTPLGALSIPGTHDSGARYGVYVCQNQSWSIERQLAAGVRYLDIRMRRSGADLAIHHGPCFQQTVFDAVLATIVAFLASNPTETVVMRAKEEHTPAPGSLPFADLWRKSVAPHLSRFLPAADALPALGAARGRILVLRDADFDGVGIRYGGELMRIQDVWDVFDAEGENPQGPNTASIPQKLRLIRAHMRAAAENNPGGARLFLNHLSGATGVAPAAFAEISNRAAFEAIGADGRRRPLGVLAMDYPGEGLIYRIIRTNFGEARGGPP